jgi:adenylyltransferase/sulfurtransferase
LPGIIGVIQATETIKLLLEKGDTLLGRLLMYDSLAMRFREIRIRRDPDCPLCGTHPTITELLNYEEFCGLEVAAPATVGN